MYAKVKSQRGKETRYRTVVGKPYWKKLENKPYGNVKEMLTTPSNQELSD